MRLQDERAERRRQCQRDKCRKRHRDRDRESKLLVKNARYTAEKGDRDKDCRENKGDGDDRSLHLRHCALRRIDGPKSLFHMLLDIFNDNDRIIDDETNGENHGKERQCIDGKVEDDKRGKRTDERHRHGEQRDQRRTPTLKEEEDDEHDEGKCFEECLRHLSNGGLDEVCTVKNLAHIEPRRKVLLSFLKDLFDTGDSLHCICVTRQLNGEGNGRIAVVLRND